LYRCCISKPDTLFVSASASGVKPYRYWEKAGEAEAEIANRDAVRDTVQTDRGGAVERKRVIDEYIDQSVAKSRYAPNPVISTERVAPLDLGEVSNALADKVMTEYGIDISGMEHVLADNDVRHIFNRHGTHTNEKYPVTAADLKLIPDIIANPDDVYYVKHDNGQTGLYYQKRYNGTTYYVENNAIGNELWGKQMLKVSTGTLPNVPALVTAIENKNRSASLREYVQDDYPNAVAENGSLDPTISQTPDSVNSSQQGLVDSQGSRQSDSRQSRGDEVYDWRAMPAPTEVEDSTADYTRNYGTELGYDPLNASAEEIMSQLERRREDNPYARLTMPEQIRLEELNSQQGDEGNDGRATLTPTEAGKGNVAPSADNSRLPTDNYAANEAKYQVNPNWEQAYDNWKSKYPDNNYSLLVGNTSDVLTGIGVKSGNITWDTSKLRDIQNKHPEMTDRIIKQVPKLIDAPLVVMDSVTVPGRITMIGELTAENGRPVFAALELNPTSKGAVIDEIKIASAYSRTQNNVQNLLDKSNILYVENSLKTNEWLSGTGLQLPVPATRGYVGTISQPETNVNSKISRQSDIGVRNEEIGGRDEGRRTGETRADIRRYKRRVNAGTAQAIPFRAGLNPLVYDSQIARTGMLGRGSQGAIGDASAVSALDKLGKALGAEVRIVDRFYDASGNEMSNANGSVETNADGKRMIYLRVKGNTTQQIKTAVLHEAVHEVSRANPEGYRALRDIVKQTTGASGDAWVNLVLGSTTQYQGVNAEFQSTTEQFANFEEEFVAEYTGAHLSDSAVVDRINASPKAKTFLERVAEALRTFIGKLTGTGDASVRALRNLEDAFANAVGSHTVDSRQETGNGERSSVSSSLTTDDYTANEAKYQVNPNFYSQYDAWNGKDNNGYFSFGTPSPALLEIGIPNRPIIMDKSKMAKVMREHQLSRKTLRGLPAMIDSPVLILKSKTQQDSYVLYGELYDATGAPVMAAMRINLQTANPTIEDVNKITSTYAKNNTQNFIDSSEALYADKERITGWANNTGLDVSSVAQHLRLQLPSTSRYDNSDTAIIREDTADVNPQNENSQQSGSLQSGVDGENNGRAMPFTPSSRLDGDPIAPTETDGIAGNPAVESTAKTADGTEYGLSDGSTVTIPESKTKWSIAYHGTPYKFDQFLLEHIGDGEGTQSHGWGLYFAADKATANRYKEGLSRSDYGYYTNGRRISGFYEEHAAANIYEGQTLEEFEAELKEIYGYEEGAKDFKKAVKEYRKFAGKEITRQLISGIEGALYTVEIPDDNVMLNEGLPLSKQPKAVRAAIKEIANELNIDSRPIETQFDLQVRNAFNNGNGLGIYSMLGSIIPVRDEIYGDQRVSLKLNEYGIKGIKYDSAQDGVCYVVFDDNAVKILDGVDIKTSESDVKWSLADGERIETESLKLDDTDKNRDFWSKKERKYWDIGVRLSEEYPGKSYSYAVTEAINGESEIVSQVNWEDNDAARWLEAGFEGDEPQFAYGRRYGEIPESGVSFNHADNTAERGVSILPNTSRDAVYEMWYGDEPITYVGGWYFGDRGSDGEPVLVGAKTITKEEYDNPSRRLDAKWSLSSPVEESRDLIAVHNLSLRNLKAAIELGGFAMPSIAVVKAEQGHNGFGDVSVVFGNDTIDPKADARNKIYSGDAWTPSMPKIITKTEDGTKFFSVSFGDGEVSDWGKFTLDNLYKALSVQPQSANAMMTVDNIDKARELTGNPKASTYGEVLQYTDPFEYKRLQAKNEPRLNYTEEEYSEWVTKGINDKSELDAKKRDVKLMFSSKDIYREMKSNLLNAIKYDVSQNPNYIPSRYSDIVFSRIVDDAISEAKEQTPEAWRDALKESVKDSFAGTEPSEGDYSASYYLDSLYDFLSKMSVGEFLEAKPQRIVPFDEVRAVIAPDGSLTESDIAELEQRGISVAEYTDGDKQSRIDALNSAATTTDAKFSLAKEDSGFIRDKYYDRQIDGWQNLNTAGYTKIGTIAKDNAITRVGMPDGMLYADNSVIKDKLTSHSDHLTADIMKQLPDVLNNPIVISQYGDGASISVFGNVFINDSPVMIGVVANKDRSGRNIVNKIQTIHARRDVSSRITDDSVLYLNEDKKTVRNWFQAIGGHVSVPLGGTRFGLIRTISQNDGNVKPKFSLSAAQEETVKTLSEELRNYKGEVRITPAAARKFTNELIRSNYGAEAKEAASGYIEELRQYLINTPAGKVDAANIYRLANEAARAVVDNSSAKTRDLVRKGEAYDMTGYYDLMSNLPKVNVPFDVLVNALGDSDTAKAFRMKHRNYLTSDGSAMSDSEFGQWMDDIYPEYAAGENEAAEHEADSACAILRADEGTGKGVCHRHDRQGARRERNVGV
jgi:hypothetical protein